MKGGSASSASADKSGKQEVIIYADSLHANSATNQNAVSDSKALSSRNSKTYFDEVSSTHDEYEDQDQGQEQERDPLPVLAPPTLVPSPYRYSSNESYNPSDEIISINGQSVKNIIRTDLQVDTAFARYVVVLVGWSPPVLSCNSANEFPACLFVVDKLLISTSAFESYQLS